MKPIRKILYILLLFVMGLSFLPAQAQKSTMSSEELKAEYIQLNSAQYKEMVKRGYVLSFDGEQKLVYVKTDNHQQREIDKYSPSKIAHQYQEALRRAHDEAREQDKQEGKASPLRALHLPLYKTAVEFIPEAAIFYLAIGFNTWQQLQLDWQTDPAAMDRFLESLEDPVTYVSFYFFMLANRKVTPMVMSSRWFSKHMKSIELLKSMKGSFNPDNLEVLAKNSKQINKARVAQTMAGYYGMAAGMLASDLFTEVMHDKDLRACSAEFFGLIHFDIDTVDQLERRNEVCDKAYSRWSLSRKVKDLTASGVGLIGSAHALAKATQYGLPLLKAGAGKAKNLVASQVKGGVLALQLSRVSVPVSPQFLRVLSPVGLIFTGALASTKYLSGNTWGAQMTRKFFGKFVHIKLFLDSAHYIGAGLDYVVSYPMHRGGLGLAETSWRYYYNRLRKGGTPDWSMDNSDCSEDQSSRRKNSKASKTKLCRSTYFDSIKNYSQAAEHWREKTTQTAMARFSSWRSYLLDFYTTFQNTFEIYRDFAERLSDLKFGKDPNFNSYLKKTTGDHFKPNFDQQVSFEELMDDNMQLNYIILQKIIQQKKEEAEKKEKEYQQLKSQIDLVENDPYFYIKLLGLDTLYIEGSPHSEAQWREKLAPISKFYNAIVSKSCSGLQCMIEGESQSKEEEASKDLKVINQMYPKFIEDVFPFFSSLVDLYHKQSQRVEYYIKAGSSRDTRMNQDETSNFKALQVFLKYSDLTHPFRSRKNKAKDLVDHDWLNQKYQVEKLYDKYVEKKTSSESSLFRTEEEKALFKDLLYRLAALSYATDMINALTAPVNNQADLARKREVLKIKYPQLKLMFAPAHIYGDFEKSGLSEAFMNPVDENSSHKYYSNFEELKHTVGNYLKTEYVYASPFIASMENAQILTEFSGQSNKLRYLQHTYSHRLIDHIYTSMVCGVDTDHLITETIGYDVVFNPPKIVMDQFDLNPCLNSSIELGFLQEENNYQFDPTHMQNQYKLINGKSYSDIVEIAADTIQPDLLAFSPDAIAEFEGWWYEKVDPVVMDAEKRFVESYQKMLDEDLIPSIKGKEPTSSDVFPTSALGSIYHESMVLLYSLYIYSKYLGQDLSKLVPLVNGFLSRIQQAEKVYGEHRGSQLENETQYHKLLEKFESDYLELAIHMVPHLTKESVEAHLKEQKEGYRRVLKGSFNGDENALQEKLKALNKTMVANLVKSSLSTINLEAILNGDKRQNHKFSYVREDLKFIFNRLEAIIEELHSFDAMMSMVIDISQQSKNGLSDKIKEQEKKK